MGDSLRDRLRALPVFFEELPDFDTDRAPADPLRLLAEWLEHAIAAGVAQPHAMSIATADARGRPSNRTLLLKDLDEEGLWFATLSTSPKGRELGENPRAALVFYWRELGRQVRVTGDVHAGPREVSEADFRQRNHNARAGSIVRAQSEPLLDVERRLSEAHRLLQDEPDFVPREWNAYLVVPDAVEFWQAAPQREQVRMLYHRDEAGWHRAKLWP